MKKKGLVLLVSICLILAVVACAAPAPAPKTTPTPTPAPAPKAQPVTLKFHMMFAEKSMEHQQIFLPWGQAVEKETNGAVKVDYYYASALGPPNGQWERVTTGVTDVEWIIPEYHAGLFPLVEVLNLPFPGIKYSTKVYSDIINALENKFPEFKAEHKAAHMLVVSTTSPNGIHTLPRPIKTLNDFKGLKIRSAGAIASDTLTLLGAAPQAMPVSEVFLNLEKKVVDGVMMSMGAFRAMKLLDHLKYHTLLSFSCVPIWIAMNTNKYNSLPKDVQTAIDKVSSKWADVAANAFDTEVDAAIAEIKSRGQELIYPSAAEEAKWREVCKGQYDQWLAKTKAKGLPGQAVLDEVLKLAAQYK